jgi:hypothetical protein
MVANVITYRALRDPGRRRCARASSGQQDAFGKALDRWGGVAATPV